MKIVYGLCGEGRGHCANFLAIAPLFDAEFLVFAGGDAYDFLHVQNISSMAGINARFLDVPPFKFRYKNGRRDIFQTVATNASTILKLKANKYLPYGTLAEVEKEVTKFAPDFIISDDEPFLNHIKRSVPLVIFDRFGKVAFCKPAPHKEDFSYKFDKLLNVYIFKMLINDPDHVITSSFYEADALDEFEHSVTSVGPVLRRVVLDQAVSDQGHVVLYATHPYVYTESFMEMIRELPRKVYVYGSNNSGVCGNIEYFDLNVENFVKHVSSCSYVISTPGNMLISEVLYLKKRIMLLYTDSFEQRENIIWASHMGFAKRLDYRNPPPAEEVEKSIYSLKEPESSKDYTVKVVEKILEIGMASKGSHKLKLN